MQRYLNENDTIGEIRQALRHPIGKSYLWVLVEGPTDQKLYAKLIDGNNTKVEMVHGGGVKRLRNSMSILIAETQQIIGIRDADFLHLNNQSETINELFLTDVHDAEMMMLLCDTVFEAVVAEYFSKALSDFPLLRERLLASLAFLGGIRWLNSTESLKLNFDSGLANFYDAENLEIDRPNCIQEIEKCSVNKQRTIQESEIDDRIANISDHYNLCNGHDFERAFALHVTAKSRSSESKSKGVSHEDIGKALRLAYRKNDFETTKLYTNLKNWEASVGHQLFSN